ncbi:hypothetical protein TRVA0_023S00254 [Trichomonascus vanleenenianus]|uniref:cohesin-loading factor complex subunit SCC2 n=1 Tax=Trichomonascus vanleenenianus TaxID=2268995 RepID=UPI003ECAC744
MDGNRAPQTAKEALRYDPLVSIVPTNTAMLNRRVLPGVVVEPQGNNQFEPIQVPQINQSTVSWDADYYAKLLGRHMIDSSLMVPCPDTSTHTLPPIGHEIAQRMKLVKNRENEDMEMLDIGRENMPVERETKHEPGVPIQKKESPRPVSIPVYMTTQSDKEKQDTYETEFSDLLERLLEESDKSERNQSNWARFSKSTEEPSLSNAALRQIETILYKFDASTGSRALSEEKGRIFQLYSILQRPMSYCQTTLIGGGSQFVQSIKTALGQNCHDDEVMRHFEICDNALVAVRTALLVFLTAIDDQELLGEEIFLDCLDTISAVFRKLVLPMAHYKHKTMNPIQAELAGLVRGLRKGLSRLFKIMKRTPLNDKALNRLQYLLLDILFFNWSEGAVFDPEEVQTMLYVGISIFWLIYKNSNDRTQIMQELLDQMSRLPLRGIKRYSITPRVKINNISALLLGMIQISGSSNYKLSASSLIESKQDDSIREFITSCKQAKNDSIRLCQELFTYLFDRAITGKADENVIKAVLESLIRDCLAVFSFPQWPAAELFLWSSIHIIYNRILKKKVPVKETNQGLDLFGIIGNTLYPLKQRETEKVLLNSTLSNSKWVLLKAEYESLVKAFRATEKLHQVSDYFVTLYANSISLVHTDKEDNEDEQQQQQQQQQLGQPNERSSSDVEFRALMTKILNSSWTAENTKQPEETYFDILLSRPISNCYDMIIVALLSNLEDKKGSPLTKSKALKTLTILVDANSSVLNFGKVQSALQVSLKDESSLVREASVALVGAHLQDPMLYNFYFKVVLDCAYNDVGTAPRKRALTSLKDLYLSGNATLPVLGEILRCFLYRTEDEEESIQKIALSSLKAVLFEKWPAKCFGDSQDLAVIEARKARVDAVIKVLSSALSLGQASVESKKAQKLFGMFFTNIEEEFQNQTSILINVLVDKINTSSSQDSESSLEFLSILAKANGKLLNVYHLTLLQTFPVEPKSGEDTKKSRYYSLVIFRCALKFITTIDEKFLKRFTGEMMQRLSSYSVLELGEAVPCLWSLTNLQKPPATYPLSRALYSSLLKLQERASKTDKVGVTRRLICLVGNMARYWKLGNHANTFKFSPDYTYNKSVKKNMDMDLVVAYFAAEWLISVSKNPLPEIQRFAIQYVGQICIGNPELFRTPLVEKFVNDIFASREMALIDAVMQTILEYLELEVQTANEIALSRKKTSKVDPSKVDISGTNIDVASAISLELSQRYLSYIKDTAVSSEDLSNNAVYTASKLINIIGTQSLATPHDLLPVVLALEASKNKFIAELGQSTHWKIHGKHESLLLNNMTAALKFSAEVRWKLVGPEITEEKHNMDRLYEVLHPRGHRTTVSSKRVFASMLRGMNISVDNRTELSVIRSHVHYAIYLVNGISTLDLRTSDEIVEIVKGINDVMRVTGEPIDHYFEEMSNSSNDAEWIRLGNYSISLLLLWHLRSYLKGTYGVTSNDDGTPVKRMSSVTASLSGHTQPNGVDVSSLVDLTLLDDVVSNMEFARSLNQLLLREFEEHDTQETANSQSQPQSQKRVLEIDTGVESPSKLVKTE